MDGRQIRFNRLLWLALRGEGCAYGAKRCKDTDRGPTSWRQRGAAAVSHRKSQLQALGQCMATVFNAATGGSPRAPSTTDTIK